MPSSTALGPGHCEGARFATSGNDERSWTLSMTKAATFFKSPAGPVPGPSIRRAATATRGAFRATGQLLGALVVFMWLAASGPPAFASGAGFAGSSGDAGPAGPPLVTAQPPNSLPGVDVSHGHGEIDWGQVAASGQGVAIAQAS